MQMLKKLAVLPMLAAVLIAIVAVSLFEQITGYRFGGYDAGR